MPISPARRADRLAGVSRLDQRQLLEVRLQRVGERAQQRRARCPARARARRAGPPARGRRPRRPRPSPRGEPRRARPPWRARRWSAGQATAGAAGGMTSPSATTLASSIVRIGPLNVLWAQPAYQIVTAEHDADHDQRRVVDVVPAERAVAGHAGWRERQAEDDRAQRDPHDRDQVHPLVLVAERPRARLEAGAGTASAGRRGSCRRCRGRSPRPK